MRLQPGDRFDRYTIEKLLGEGGMGEVYRAHDSRLHRRVALKVLRKTPGADPDSWGQAAARMLREGRAAAALSHPNTVAIYDVGEHDGAPYLAMELVEGKPLRSFVGADVPQSTRLRWLLEVARALSAAHHAGLVHRDVKPENVMLREDGVLKVLDFGIARRVRLAASADVGATGESAAPAESTASTVTAPGVLVGTPAYMAPEQIRGEDLDGRADQFSWGVMAHELLSGRLPFGPGRDAIGVIAAMLGEPPPPLREVPEVVAVVVERALAKRREDRFASMDELIELLEPFITGEMAMPSSRRLSQLSQLATLSTLSTADAAALGGGRSSAPGAAGDRASAPTAGGERPGATTISAVQGDAPAVPAPRRRPRWPIAVALAALLGGGAAAAARWRARSPPPPTPAPAIPAPPAPTPVTALPPPKTQSPQALAAYQEGLQQFRDARWHAAHAAFQRAVELDPTFAAAHLRLAQTMPYFGTVTEGRQVFQRAIALRTGLGERDQALLEALEPYLLRNPPDRTEAWQRVQAMSRRYPADAELFALLSGILSPEVPEARLELAERCTALDPEYADCWQSRAGALLVLGRPQEAVDALTHCVEASPYATDCIVQRAHVHEHAGRCDRFEDDARRSAAQVPDDPNTYLDLAAALYARGRPLSNARAVLEQGQQQMRGPNLEFSKRQQEILVTVLTGDLRAAERLAERAAAWLARDPSASRHIYIGDARVRLLQEMGQEEQAARVAEELLGRQDALVTSPHQIEWQDVTVFLLKAKLRGGRLDRGAYEASRGEWLRRWESRPETRRWGLWFAAHASPVSTPEEAREALEVLPDYLPLPDSWEPLEISTVLGKVYLLADRPAEALPYLESATRSCSALKEPLAHTLALYHLGLAREARGDSAGACAAYRDVLARWPDRAMSRTARAVSARVSQLRCPQ